MVRRFAPFAMLALLLALLTLWAAPVLAQPVRYQITRVHAPAGHRYIQFHAVNNLGEAAGIIFNGPYKDIALVVRRTDGTLELPEPPAECQWKYATRYRVLGYNDRGQMLVQACANPYKTNAALWTPGVGWTWVMLQKHRYYQVLARGLNNLGQVVGTAGGASQVGFVWNGPGHFTTMAYDGGIDFKAINDRGDIAATITHVPGDKKYDREGVSAALVPHGGGDPIYTGDGNINTLKDYKDKAHRSYEVNSHAWGINNAAQLAIDSPRDFESRRTTACRWGREKGVQCTYDYLSKGSNLIPVGINGDGDVFMRDDQKYGTSYVLRAKGRRYKLGDLCEPRAGEIVALGASEAGFVVGRSNNWNSDYAFILTPLK